MFKELSKVKEELEINPIKFQKKIMGYDPVFSLQIHFTEKNSQTLSQVLFHFWFSDQFVNRIFGHYYSVIQFERIITDGRRTDTKVYQRIKIRQLFPFLKQYALPQIFLFVLGIYNYQDQTKQNMAYHFPSTWLYGQFPLINHFFPNYGYQTFQSFQTLQHFLPMQFSTNDQMKEGQNELGVQVKNADTRDAPINESDEISSIEVKKNRESKMKKKSRNVHKELESAKKNCESNLVNQFLSYFSSLNNSSALILRAFRKMNLEQKLEEKKRLEQAMAFFCKQVSIVNSRKERKYVNKAFLQNFFEEAKLQKYMVDILQNVEKSDLMSKKEFCELFRRCCFHFFRTVSIASVTSSAKLNPISRPEHIKRRRMIVETLSKN